MTGVYIGVPPKSANSIATTPERLENIEAANDNANDNSRVSRSLFQSEYTSSSDIRTAACAAFPRSKHARNASHDAGWNPGYPDEGRLAHLGFLTLDALHGIPGRGPPSPLRGGAHPQDLPHAHLCAQRSRCQVAVLVLFEVRLSGDICTNAIGLCPSCLLMLTIHSGN